MAVSVMHVCRLCMFALLHGCVGCACVHVCKNPLVSYRSDLFWYFYESTWHTSFKYTQMLWVLPHHTKPQTNKKMSTDNQFTMCLNLHHINDPKRSILRDDVPLRSGKTVLHVTSLADITQSNMRICREKFQVATEFPCGTYMAMKQKPAQTRHTDVLEQEWDLANWDSVYCGTISYPNMSNEQTELWELSVPVNNINLSICLRPPMTKHTRRDVQIEFHSTPCHGYQYPEGRYMHDRDQDELFPRV